MTQLVVTLKDQSYLPNIRRIVKSLQGVERVSTARKPRAVAQKSAAAGKRGSTNFLSGLAIPKGTTSRQLVDEYLDEKYGV